MNDMGDLEAPIQRPRWQDAEPANEVQAKAWGDYLDQAIAKYDGLTRRAAIVGLLHHFQVRLENYDIVSPQVERFIQENYVVYVETGHLAMRMPLSLLDEMSKAPKAIQDAAIKMVGGKVDDYICKGCGNNKCSTDEKSCWKCGRAIGT